MPVLHTQSRVVARNCALRFPTDSDGTLIASMIDAWNQRFTESFPGTGYFSKDPEIEVFSDGDAIVASNAYYLHADTKFWKAIEESRSFTVDEPVLAVANA